MSSVILIHKLGEEVPRIYGKPDNVKLEIVTDPAVLWSVEPKVYLTGLSALPTQKRLVKLLASIDPSSSYTISRAPAEDHKLQGLTARATREGRVMPKYGNGG